MDSLWLVFLILGVAGAGIYLSRKQIPITLWYLGRRWHLWERWEEPRRCAILMNLSLKEIRDIFQYAAKKFGKKCEFDHKPQYVDKNRHGHQLLSCRVLDGDYQYHFRVMPTPEENGFLITGHRETTPEAHPIMHYFGVRADFGIACELFLTYYEEYRKSGKSSSKGLYNLAGIFV